MRIRTFFLACFCGVALPGAAASLWLSTSSWSAWQRAEDARIATRAVSDAQRAQTAIAVEVGAFAAQLRALNPDLELSRAAAPGTDRMLRAAAASARAGGFQASLAEDAMARIQATRQRALAEMAKPLAAREADLPNVTQAVRNETADALRRLGVQASLRVFDTAPDTAMLVEIASAAMDFRDYIGRRSVPVTAWIGGLPVQPQTYDEMQQYTGRMEQAWASAQRLIAAMPDNARLQQALRQQQAIQAENEPRWRRMLAIGRGALAGGGAEWGTTVPEFRPWSLRSQADILSLRDAALDESMAVTDTASDGAWLNMLEALALALLVCGLAALSALLLLRRVVQPLRALTGSVTRIAEGELDAAVPGQGRADELGEMAAAVETLRAGSAERREMAAAQQEEQRQQIARAGRVDTLLRGFEAETAGALRAVASAATEMDATAGGMAEIAASGNTRASSVANASL